MLHLHDSSKRVWLCVGLLAFLFAASGAARAQGRPDDAELLKGLAQPKPAPEGAKAEAAGAKIEAAVAVASQPEAKHSPEAKQPEVKKPGVAPASKNAQAASTLQFSAASYVVPEGGGSVTVTVTRAGPSDSAVSVEYKAANKSASQTSDYTFAAGRLDFASGETAKTFVLITDDSYVEGTESAEVSLSNATGDASLGNPSTASIVINDDRSRSKGFGTSRRSKGCRARACFRAARTAHPRSSCAPGIRPGTSSRYASSQTTHTTTTTGFSRPSASVATQTRTATASRTS